MGHPPTSGLNKEPARLSDEFGLSAAQIGEITLAAAQTFQRQQSKAYLGAKAHVARVDESLRGIHPSLSANADLPIQAEQHLFSSIITALRPFYSGE